ncbi:MAG: gliding motility-associated C-terminal domain-containing protein [Bacteroidota bacterium]
MKKTLLKSFKFNLILIFGTLNQTYSQCTTTTVNIDFAGAQANGCCNVCGNDYRCYTNGSATACTFGASFSNTFVDPVPPGNIVVGVQVNYYYSGCSGGAGTMATLLNGIPIGNANFSVNNCSCGSCFFTSTPNTPFNCGIPSYNYGGNNTVSGNVSGFECIDRIEVVLCYRSSTPNAGTASSSASSICSGQSVNLTLTGYQTGASIQWQSAPTSGGPWTNIPGATAATYASGPLSSNICYRALVTCGGNNTSNVVCITVNSPPSVSVSSATICAGQSATLTSVVNPVGGSYSWTPGGMTTPSIVVSPPSTQAYNLTYTDPNGCTGTASGTVFVNTSPVITVNSPTICVGQTTTLTANGVPGGGTYLWSPSGNTSNTEVVSPSSTTTYTVQYTTGSGCSGTAVSTVVVNPIPTVAVNNATICGSGSATLVANVNPTGGLYLWSPGGMTTPTVVVSPVSTTTYNLQYIAPTGCSNTAVGIVYVSNLPTVAVNNATLCSAPGASVILTATVSPSGGTFTWSPIGGGGPIVVVSPTSSTGYTVTYTEPGGCSASAVGYVTVMPGFSFADFTYPNHPCVDNQPYTFSATVSGSGPYAYQWYFGNGSSPSTATTLSASVNYAYSGIKYVSLVVNNLSSGCKDSIVHQVTIEDLPFVNFSASSPNCVTDTVYFNNYSWIGGSATIASWYWDFGDGNNSTAFQPSHLYASGGTYTVYLVATSDFGCDDTLYKVVNVSPLTVAGNVTSNATVCAVSNTGTLNLNGNNGNVISWMYSTDNGLTWLPIVNTNTSYVYTNLQQTTIFGAVVQSGSCPSATTSPNATITVDAASNAGFVRRDTLICSPPNQGTLTLTNYTGSIVDWYSSNDNGVTWTALGNTSPTYTFANLLDTTQFAVIVQNGICPPDTSNAPFTTVWVRYFNSAQVIPSPDTTISVGFTVQLNAMGGYFYAWSPNYNISDTTIHNPSVWPTKDTSYMVYVVDKYGCTDVDTVRIFVQKDYKLVIANTLTPNGDNFNDFFWIGMIEYYPNNEVIVFNRYGQEIFKGNNYDNKKVFWDGTYQGNKVPDGAYYYVIKFKDNNTVFKGSINVISSH